MKKSKHIHDMFSSIAERYDMANRVLTLGLDSLWRKKTVQLSQVQKNHHILDCATGTGLLAFEFLKSLGQEGRIVGVDFCEKMLQQIKISDPRICFQKADVMNLPFDHQIFDIVSVAYGLRNLSDMKKGIQEMIRVTKKGGVLMILDTGEPTSLFSSAIFKFYFKNVVPALGGWITGNKEAYSYLNESSADFPSGKKMVNILNQTRCFQKIDSFVLFGGASYIYRAVTHKHH